MKKRVIAFVVAAIKDKNKYLLTKRIDLDPEDPQDFSGKWQLPGGGIEFGETTDLAIKREIKEELNLEIKIINLAPYVINSLRPYWQGVGIVYLCEPKNHNLEIKLNEEANEFSWFSKREIYNLDVLPGVMESIEAIENKFY